MTEATLNDLIPFEMEMVLTDIESIHESLVKDGKILERVITHDAVREFSDMKRTAMDGGVCVRCGRLNDQSKASPYCGSCYHTWAKFYS